MLLEQLAEELLHLLLRIGQGVSTLRCDPVEAPRPLGLTLLSRLEIAFALQTMQHWIERAGAELIAVPAELLADPAAVDRLFRRVVQHVQPDQPNIEVRVTHRLT